jgi:cytochrome c biogenesis protein CcdA
MRALLACLLACAAAAAAPQLKVATDRSEDAASVFAGSPIDLVLRVTPGPEGIAAEGLAAAAEASGASFGAAILPPPGADGVHREPFAVRIPMTVAAAGKLEAKARLSGKTAAGEAFSVEGAAKVRADATKGGHVTGSATLREPAVAGVPNAVVLDLSVIGGYHVYGKDVQYGLPFTAELLPQGPEPLWTGGGRVTPGGENVHGSFQLEIPFTPLEEGRVETRVALFWQACTEQVCDPNEVGYVPVAFDVAKGARGTTSEADGIWKLILASIGGALFALAMPCTYPLIPITISFFTKQAEKRHGRVAPLAFAYGGGIVVIFAGIGVLAGTVAASATAVLDVATNPWVNGTFAVMFVVFGLSLVGLFDIRLPSWFDDLASRAGGGGYASVFAMGATLVITSFTCTAPIVGAVLADAVTKGVERSTLSMTVFGLTMAIPFVFLSLSPQALQKLPKSGVWMKHLKVTLGILEIGLALKFVSQVDLALETHKIGRELFLVLWAVSFLAAGIYLLAAGGLTRGRGVAAVLVLALGGYLLTGLRGAIWPAQLEGFFPKLPKAEATSALPDYSDGFAAVVIDDYGNAVEVARAKGLPLLIHFTGFQ